MRKTCVIVDCYTVEPAGLGFPPFISTYARYAFGHSRTSGFETFYLTIDDIRGWNAGLSKVPPDTPASNPYIYSLTNNLTKAGDLLAGADRVVVIAGDTVPSKHMQAVSASLNELQAIIKMCPCADRILVGPLAGQVARIGDHPLRGLFSRYLTHGFVGIGRDGIAEVGTDYEKLRVDMKDLTCLFGQIPWQTIAEIELYQGCTRKTFCSFCFEPIKNPVVIFRPVNCILEEVLELYRAGVTRFRLGQQACFFSYQNGNLAEIERLLEGIRVGCSDLDVLHIDNVDPLAAASPNGRRIAKIVASYCTAGNTAPMGIESFDPDVISVNRLTCTPEILIRAMSNIEEFGAERTDSGLFRLLPGLNLIYGLPGETAKTHERNLTALSGLLDGGHLAGRTNVRQVAIYSGTPLVQLTESLKYGEEPRLRDTRLPTFEACKTEIANAFEIPMKRRVYPFNLRLKAQHAFYQDENGAWLRAYGSYAIMTVVPGEVCSRYSVHDLQVIGHQSRHLIGQMAN